ncbi:MAG TPA: PKD domain-containing protein [Microthrixaceae bacterium]|nr:PKD domain-containing protein [Microthrixaceae bacterium]
MRIRVGVLALAAFALLAAACTSGGGAPTGGHNFKFRATKVSVVNHNDSFLYGTRDEVYALNVWFRVKYNQPGSAQVGIAGHRDHAFDDLGDGQSLVYTGNQMAEVNFPGVQLYDVLDLINPSNHLELVGVWTWAMDQDDVSVTGVANDLLPILKGALDATVAAAVMPTDANFLVDIVFDDVWNALSLVAGALFGSIPGIPDDPIGSRVYVGIGAGGTLSQIMDAATSGVNIPELAIPIVTVPPDIDGGRIFSLGHNSIFGGEVMDQGEGRHDYEVQVINAATINQLPFANFFATPTSGSPPLAVSFNAGGSADPDGSIVAYDWNFGDFTSGSGPIASHVYTTAGNYPVRLTVTDNRGESSVKTTNISIGGAPTAYPTGLTKVGQGCCDTYGDFAWTMVPGAEAYQVDMDGFVLGGCVTDHGAVLEGQRSSGRVQGVGLCLGSQYDVKIRARANGLWGPWSPTTRITL